MIQVKNMIKSLEPSLKSPEKHVNSNCDDHMDIKISTQLDPCSQLAPQYSRRKSRLALPNERVV